MSRQCQGNLESELPTTGILTTLWLVFMKVFKQSADLFDDEAVDEDFLDAVTQAEAENVANADNDDGDDVMPTTQHKRIMQIQEDENSMGEKSSCSSAKLLLLKASLVTCPITTL